MNKRIEKYRREYWPYLYAVKKSKHTFCQQIRLKPRLHWRQSGRAEVVCNGST